MRGSKYVRVSGSYSNRGFVHRDLMTRATRTTSKVTEAYVRNNYIMWFPSEDLRRDFIRDRIRTQHYLQLKPSRLWGLLRLRSLARDHSTTAFASLSITTDRYMPAQNMRVCFQYSRLGECVYGSTCKFQHVQSSQIKKTTAVMPFRNQIAKNMLRPNHLALISCISKCSSRR